MSQNYALFSLQRPFLCFKKSSVFFFFFFFFQEFVFDKVAIIHWKNVEKVVIIARKILAKSGLKKK
jgi:hypothetical protein